MDIQCLLENISLEKNLCEYWDIRIEEVFKTAISYEDFELKNFSKKPSLGAFIRVYEKGLWHGLSTTNLNNLNEELKSLVKQAQSFQHKSQANSLKPYNSTALEKNLINFSSSRLDKVSELEKKKVLESYFEDIKKFKKIKKMNSTYTDEYKIKYFLSSKDVKYSYDFNSCKVFFSWTLLEHKNHFSDHIKFEGTSLEDLKGFNSLVCKEIEESYEFLEAKAVSLGEYPVVLGQQVTGFFTHESFGHSMEADGMGDVSKAKQKWKIGQKVADECVSIVDYGGSKAAGGYCPFDDEGFVAQKTYIIKKGILKSRLHSQTTAHSFDEAPTGNGRALDFEFHPIVRMTNTYIEPGEKSFNELIEKVKLGVFIKDCVHGTGMSTFTIAPRKCYMIREGKIAEPVRASLLTGKVYETLKRIKACSKDYRLDSGGCGKNGQMPLSVGTGGPQIFVEKMFVS